ncbi:MAG: hypothetical protein J6Y89_04055, partial [Lachnospiraceae bacterium]|nr:hypothetical protein [Lachnospiraceae bacterium]
MKKIPSRIFSIFMVMIMILAMLPKDPAGAASPFSESQAKSGIQAPIKIFSSLTIGDNYSGSPIYVVHDAVLTVAENAVITSDIYVEDRACIQVYGTVTGTIHITTDTFSSSSNFELNGVCSSVDIDGTGRGWIGGYVGKLTFSRGDGELFINNGATVQYLEMTRGTYTVYQQGHCETAIVTMGEFDTCNGGITDYLEIGGTGYASNQNGSSCGRIGSVLLREDCRESKNWANFNNDGLVDTLVAKAGYLGLSGHIGNVVLLGCNQCNIDVKDNAVDPAAYGYDNMIDNLFASRDAHVVFTEFSPASVGFMRIDSSYMHCNNVRVQQIMITGEYFDGTINSGTALDVFIDVDRLTEETHIDLESGNLITSGFHVSSDFAAKNANTIRKMLGDPELTDEEILQGNELYDVVELPHYASTKEYSVSASAGDILTFTLNSPSQLAAAVIYAPDGHISSAAACGGTGSVSCMSTESGVFNIVIYGAEYGADGTYSKSSAVPVTINAKLYNSAFPDETPSLFKTLPLYSFYYELYDNTAGRYLNIGEYMSNGSALLFSPELSGHNISVRGIHSYGSLYGSTGDSLWGYSPLTGSFTIGSDSNAELTGRSYAQYYVFFSDESADAVVYLYDSNGRFYHTNGYYDNKFFLSSQLPVGNYTAVLIDDPSNSFCFKQLSDFERIGLKEKEDYLVDHFSIIDGTNIMYPNATVPSQEARSLDAFNMSGTYFYARNLTVATGMPAEIILDYEFNEGYAENVSDIYAIFEMNDDTSLVPDSVSVNGTASEYTLTGNEIRVSLDGSKGTAGFCCKLSKNSGSISAIGRICYTYRGRKFTDLISGTTVQVTQLSLNGPTVSTGYVGLNGVTNPGTTVTVLDGDTAIGTATALENGVWSVRAQLSDVEEHDSYHSVSAAVNYGTSKEIRSQTLNVLYSSFMPELNYMTMYYQIHGRTSKITIRGEDFGVKPFNYDYWPGTVFTFELKIDNDEWLDKVYVVSTANGRYSLEAFKDGSSGKWIASGMFSEDENYAPAEFQLHYVFKEITDADYAVINDNINKYFENFTNSSIEESPVKLSMDSCKLVDSEESYDENSLKYTNYSVYEADELGMVIINETESMISNVENTVGELMEAGYTLGYDKDENPFLMRV